jgi:hypothetical protein
LQLEGNVAKGAYRVEGLGYGVKLEQRRHRLLRLHLPVFRRRCKLLVSQPASIPKDQPPPLPFWKEEPRGLVTDDLNLDDGLLGITLGN